MGQVEEATTQLQASAPTARVLPPPSALTAQAPEPPPIPRATPSARPAPKSTGKGLGISFAALILAGVGGTAWWLTKGHTPASSPAPAKTGSESDPVPGDAKTPQAQAATFKGTATPSTPLEPPATPKPAPSEPPKPGLKPEGRPEPPRPEPTRPQSRPAEAKTEAKAIDQPDLYRPEKLDKLEVHERKNLGNVSMSEAIQISESQPEKAIQGFRQAIKADPTNASARAWLAWVLINQGRTQEFVHEVSEGRRLGLLGQMNQNVRFRSALSKARLNQQLPPDLAN
jgi:hypothetical protein